MLNSGEAELIKLIFQNKMDLKDEEIEVSNQLIERQNLEIDNLKTELETYKKIAEKLAERLTAITAPRKEYYIRYDNSKRYFLNWARKEAIKNEKTNI